MRAVLIAIMTIGWVSALLTDELPLTIRIEAEAVVCRERFHLGEIATLVGGSAELRERLAQIELGASPLPGQRRIFTRQQLLTRLRQHGIDLRTVQVEMPDTIRLIRTAQTVPMSRLEQFAREELKRVLGEEASEWQLENAPSREVELAVPDGELTFQRVGEPRVGTDRAVVEVQVLVNGQPKSQHTFRFRAPQRSRVPLVRSGEMVQVQVRVEGVLLEASGVARASGAEGEVIPVYISTTQKTVRARVIEKGRVEVLL